MKALALLLCACGGKVVDTPAELRIPIMRYAETPDFELVGNVIEARARYEGAAINRVNVQCTIVKDDQGASFRYDDLVDDKPVDVREDLPAGSAGAVWFCAFLTENPGTIVFELESGGQR